MPEGRPTYDPDMSAVSLAAWPRRYLVPVAVMLVGGAAWWAWRAEPRPLNPAHLAAVVLMLAILVATWLALMLRSWSNRPDRGYTVLALHMASAFMLLGLSHGVNGPGTIGIYTTAFSASRRGKFGAAIATVTGAGYLLAATWTDATPTNLIFTLIGYVAAYGFAALGHIVRRDQVERIASDERQRLAREIHDVLAHNLSALAVQLEATRLLAEQRPGDPEVARAIDRAHRVATDGLAEAKRAVGALRGDALPGPELLGELVREFEASGDLRCRLEVTGKPVPLAPEARLAIYRAAQEGLTNVRKHAHARDVTIRLQYRRGGAELTVEDVGEAPSPRTSAGYGLSGMRERAELLGGTLDAGPTRDGFRLRLWVPA